MMIGALYTKAVSRFISPDLGQQIFVVAIANARVQDVALHHTGRANHYRNEDPTLSSATRGDQRLSKRLDLQAHVLLEPLFRHFLLGRVEQLAFGSGVTFGRKRRCGGNRPPPSLLVVHLDRYEYVLLMVALLQYQSNDFWLACFMTFDCESV